MKNKVPIKSIAVHKNFPQALLWFLQIVLTLIILTQMTFGSNLAQSTLREELPGLASKVIMGFHGGGGRGLISAYILKELESKLPTQNINDYVTHYAGNSTGAILAAGLASGKTVEDMINFYLNDGPEIFSSKTRNFSYPLFNSKYDRTVFDKKLVDGFAGLKMGDLNKGLLVMANQLFTTEKAEQGPIYFNTEDPKCSDFLLSDIVSATCSAPTIFEPYRGIPGYTLIDGGVIENNPSMGAYMAFTQPRDDSMLISIGTGRYANAYDPHKMGSMGVLQWASSLPHMQARETSVLADRRLEKLMGRNYAHYTPELNEYIELDDLSASTILKMQTFAMEYISRPEIQSNLLMTASKLVVKRNRDLTLSNLLQSTYQEKNKEAVADNSGTRW